MSPASVRIRPRLGVCGGLAVACFLLLVARFWHPVYGFTAFFQLDASNDELKISPFRDYPVYVHRGTGGYDGLYYAQIAQDPTLRSPELPRAMDNFAYRARRILPPALAWLLGGGQPGGVILAYSVLNLVSWLALALVLWRLLPVEDARGLGAWAGILFSAGALNSVRFALTDLPATTILAAAIWAAERWRGRGAVVLLAAATLARETAFVAVAGLCKPPWCSGKNLARILLVAAPLFAWLCYIRHQVGIADQGWSNFSWPLSGLVQKVRADLNAVGTIADRPLAWTTLLSTGALVTQAGYFLCRPRSLDRWWRIGCAYALVMLCLGTAVWEGFPGAATRVLLPLTLAFNLHLARSRAPLLWLIAGNLSVLAGLLTLRDLPSDPREVAAVRSQGTACVARSGEGWYNRETSGRHRWFWTAQRGTIELESWPRVNDLVQLTVGLRSPQPCTIIIREGAQELVRTEVGATLLVQSIPVRLSAGHAVVEFSTAAPAVRESAAAGGRALAFALYDPSLSVPKR